MKSWFQPARAGWNPDFFEGYFRTPLGAAIRAKEEKAVYGFLGVVMEPNHTVLELGPGTGNYTVPLAQRCAEVVAIDSSPEMLRYLRGRLLREGLANVETRLGELPEELETPGKKFDGVLAIGVLNYVRDIELSLPAFASALVPGGWAVFNVPLPTVEGRIYALAEFAGRRRIYLHDPKEILDLIEKAGMRAQMMVPTGLTRGGLTLMVGARVPAQAFARTTKFNPS